MTALRRPYLAAATATLVALPPRNLPNLCTCCSGVPTCSGYRSTPTRPMVSTSNASAIEVSGQLGQERHARLHVGPRPLPLRWLGVEHAVLLHDVPAAIVGVPQGQDDRGDVDVAVAACRVQPSAYRLTVGDLTGAHRPGERVANVLEVHVPDACRRVAGERDRVDTARQQ